MAEVFLLCIELIIVNKVMCLLLSDAINVRYFVSELDTVEFIGVLQQLRPKINNE